MEIELGRITTFVGKTSIGKSAILRALRWLAQNYPAGNEFIRDGAKFCRVRLVVDNHTVTRKVGKVNEYRLDDQLYVSFGRGVPDAVLSTLNCTDENFQGQMDAPFWFSLTPGQVAKELNRIINLGVIDGTLAAVATETRKAKATVEVTRERLKEAKVVRDGLTHVPALAARLEGLREQEAAVASLNARICALRHCVAEGVLLAKQAKQAATGLIGGRSALKAGAAWTAAKEEVERLKTIVRAIETQESKLCQLQNAINGLQSQLSKQRSCPLCGAMM